MTSLTTDFAGPGGASRQQAQEGTALGQAPGSNGTVPGGGDHIADILVKQGRITPEQLRYAQRIRGKLNSAKTLIGILQELHFISSDEMRAALRSSRVNIPLGSLLVELGYLRDSDLKVALALQSERAGTKLGQVLI